MSQAEETVKLVEMKYPGIIRASLDDTGVNKQNDALIDQGVILSRHDELVDLIAENAHDVWARDKMADGWTYAPVRDNEAKHHPMLIPYDELPESEKEYDKKVGVQFVNSALGFRNHMKNLEMEQENQIKAPKWPEDWKEMSAGQGKMLGYVRAADLKGDEKLSLRGFHIYDAKIRVDARVDSYRYNAVKPIALKKDELSFLNEMRSSMGMQKVEGVASKEGQLVKQEDIVSALFEMRERMTKQLSKMDAFQLSALAHSDIWNKLETLDKKVMYSVDDMEDNGPSQIGIFVREFKRHPDRVVYDNDFRDTVLVLSESALEDLRMTNGLVKKPFIERVLDFFRGEHYEPVYQQPPKEEIQSLRNRGNLTSDTFGMAEYDIQRAFNRLSSDMGLSPSFAELFFSDYARENIQKEKKEAAEGQENNKAQDVHITLRDRVEPHIVNKDSFIQQTIDEVTDINQQLSTTGRTEGYFMLDPWNSGSQPHLVQVSEKDGDLKIVECSAVHEFLLKELLEKETKLPINGKEMTFVFDSKILGEMAFGKTVEARSKETGEYVSFAYDMKTASPKPSASFEERLKESLKAKETQAVKESIKESMNRSETQTRSEGTKTKIK